MPGPRVPPYIKNLRRPPVKYVVEVFRDSTGLWNDFLTVPVIWPNRWTYKRTWYGRLVLREVKDVGNKAAIAKARSTAHKHTELSMTRIVEVKDTGYRYIIFEYGRWIPEFCEIWLNQL